MLKTSISPHIHSPQNIEYAMRNVLIAMVPALLASVYFFGVRALWLEIISILTAILAETLMQLLLRKPVTVSDGSAAITGLLVAFNMPPNIPFYVPVVATALGIIVVKQLFGGLGHNIFNPALVGRVFVMFAWLPEMTTWNVPLHPDWIRHFNLFHINLDSITSATPLAVNKLQGMSALVSQFGSKTQLYLQSFLGNTGGCIGETSELAILIGAFYLFSRKVIWPTVPFVYIITVAVLTALMGQDPLFHILSGGLFLGAFFMATDYVTTPMTLSGSLVYAVGLGLLTVILRLKSGLPEGVSFSILLMNGLTPLIDKLIRVRTYGKQSKRGRDHE
ncbi:MAG: RnfABCDGE type electron transport complex subunit D [bacterium]|nr:RnfABCDGE type electron transport complex subunit D [bacterium]